MEEIHWVKEVHGADGEDSIGERTRFKEWSGYSFNSDFNRDHFKKNFAAKLTSERNHASAAPCVQRERLSLIRPIVN